MNRSDTKDERDYFKNAIKLVAVITLRVLYQSTFYTPGILLLKFREKWNASSPALLNSISAVALGCATCGFGIASILMKHFGCGKTVVVYSIGACACNIISAFLEDEISLLVVFGIIQGLSLSANGIAGTVVIQGNFSNNRGLLQGLYVGFSSLISFGWSPFTEWLLYHYGLSGTFLLFAGLQLQALVCGMLVILFSNDAKPKTPTSSKSLSTVSARVDQQISDQKPYTSKSDVKSDRKSEASKSDVPSYMILKKYFYMVHWFTDIFVTLVVTVELIYLPTLGVSIGESKQRSAFLDSVSAVGCGAGAVIFGFVGNIESVKSKRMLIEIIATMAAGALKLCVPYMTTYIPLMVFAVLQGLALGCYLSALNTVGVDLAGDKLVNISSGMLGISGGIAISFAGAVTGALEDEGGLARIFTVMGALQIAICVVRLCNYVCWKVKTRQKKIYFVN